MPMLRAVFPNSYGLPMGLTLWPVPVSVFQVHMPPAARASQQKRKSSMINRPQLVEEAVRRFENSAGAALRYRI